MGRSLLSAAAIENKQRISGSETDEHSDPIKVTLRLTRLDPHPQDLSLYDPRISKTILELQEMGIDVQFGELETPPPQPRAPPRILCPTMKVNLDLSILIALISDLSHSPLPSCMEEADARFIPPASYVEWKRKKKENATRIYADVTDRVQKGVPDTVKHSRAMVSQALQEMDRGLIQEIHNQLAFAVKQSSSDPNSPVPSMSSVEFWTTSEARTRCLRIVSKIGGPNEKRRAQALFFPSSSAEQIDNYWHGSRFARDFIPIPPVHVFPPSPSDSSLPVPQESVATYTNGLDSTTLSFFQILEATCTHILSHETIPHSITLAPRLVATKASQTLTDYSAHSLAYADDVKATGDGDGDIDDTSAGERYTNVLLQGEIQRAAVTKANPKLTAHTVHSMLQGAKRGWTTLTANKASIKAILKEIKVLHGPLVAGPPVGGRDGKDGVDEGANALIEKAAIWILDPRSLAEGMRSDLV
jgi:hypothetical protein